MATPAARAMQQDDYDKFCQSLRAVFNLYAGRKITPDMVNTYWGFLRIELTIDELPGALRSACRGSPQYPPSAMQIADCAAHMRAHEQMLMQGSEVVGRRKQLAGRSEDSRHAVNVREVAKVIDMLKRKMSA